MEQVLLHPDRLDLPDLAAYERAGGYEGLGKALAMPPAGMAEWKGRAPQPGRGGFGRPSIADGPGEPVPGEVPRL
jgi:hypothetical protein